MKIITGEPLPTGQIFFLTKKDACTVMGNYKVRIMNFSEGQEIDVIDTVEWNGYKWGIKPISKPTDRYEYFAVKVKE